MNASYVFTSHVRRGLAATVTGPQADGRARATVAVEASVAERGGSIRSFVHSQPMTVLGPPDVTGLAAGQVVRVTPVDGDADAEPNYLASVEFAHPDLPWMFSPEAELGGHVRPWLALVVVPEPAAPRVRAVAGCPNPVLVAAGGELPEWQELWAWAHTQTVTSDPAAVDALVAHPDTATTRSRLLSSRRLDPHARYVACVVPTFESGRRAGLALGDGGGAAAAWKVDDAAVALPVYHHWRFRTGAPGDFETLAGKLRPAPPEVRAAVGYRTTLVDPTASRLVPAAAARPFDAVVLRVRTAITAPDVDDAAPEPGSLSPVAAAPDAARDAVVGLLGEVLDRGEVQRREGSDRPVVGPPTYGQWHAEARTLRPLDGAAAPPPWLAELNVDPEPRAVAGVGAQLVQHEQEALIAAAWDQLAGVVAANRRQRWGQLFLHTGAAHHRRRLEPRTDGALLQAVRPALSRLVGGAAHTLAAEVSASAMPAVVMSATFARVARRAAALGPGTDVPSASVLDAIAPGLLAGTSTAGPTRFLARNRPSIETVAELLRGAGLEARLREVTGSGVQDHLLAIGSLAEQLGTLDEDLRARPPKVFRPPVAVAQVPGGTIGEAFGHVVTQVVGHAAVASSAGISPSVTLGSVLDRPPLVFQPNPTGTTSVNIPADATVGSLLQTGPRLRVAQQQAPLSVVAPDDGIQLGGNVAGRRRRARTGREGIAIGPLQHAGIELGGIELGESIAAGADAIALSLSVLNELTAVQSIELSGADDVIDLSAEAAGVLRERVASGEVAGIDLPAFDAIVRVDENPLASTLLRKLVGADAIAAADVPATARLAALLGRAQQVLALPGVTPPPAFVAIRPERVGDISAKIAQLGAYRPPADRLVPPAFPAVSIAELRARAIDGLDAAVQYRRMLEWSLRLVDPTIPRRRSPSHPIMASPRFGDPFVDRLARLDRNWVLGGASALPPDSITVLSDNRRFVESVFAGANHEFARELLWRRYPTDQMGTCFARFWPTVPERAGQVPPDDIAAMATWGGELGRNPVRTLGEATAIIVLRGQLLRRYPETIVAAVYGRAIDVEPDPRFEPDAAIPPAKELFRGFLPEDITYVALDISPRRLVEINGESGWFISLTQPVELPRFGADEELPGGVGQPDPTDINDLSWPQIEAAGLLDTVTRHLRVTHPFPPPRPPMLDDWGPDVPAATVAAALMQLPFQLLLRAADYLPTA